jgi:hypothetical protein
VFSCIGYSTPTYFIQENTKIIVAKIANTRLREFLIFFVWIIYLLKILCYLITIIPDPISVEPENILDPTGVVPEKITDLTNVVPTIRSYYLEPNSYAPNN